MTKEPTLDEYLSGDEGETLNAGELTPGADPDKINRVLHRLGTLQKRIDANAALAEAQRKRVTEWETTVNTPLQESANFLIRELTYYALKEREANPRQATISLPSGKLATRATAAKVEVEDPTAYLRWALTQAKTDPALKDTFKVETKPMLPAIKKLFSADGDSLQYVTKDGEMEPVPGTRVTQPEERFTVVVKPDV